jgi:uncharacterized membrane protein HdeD (DUF308 family)
MKVNSFWPLLAGVLGIAAGLKIMLTGVDRAVILGQERYFVGGLCIAIGVFAIAVAFFPDRSNENNKKDGGSQE